MRRRSLDKRDQRDVLIDGIHDIFAEPEILLLDPPPVKETCDRFARRVEYQLSGRRALAAS
jgi:hypothetical protein